MSATMNTIATTAADARRPYLPLEVGKNAADKVTAFHMEGYIGQPPYFREAADGRKAFLSVSMGMGKTDEAVMAMAEGTFDKSVEYGGSEFCRVKIFGPQAETLARTLDKGRRIAVTGELSWNEFKKSDGTAARQLVVTAREVVLLGNKTTPAVPVKDFVPGTKVYTDKDGAVHRQGYASLLCGTVKNNWGCKTSANGKAYTQLVLTIPQPAEKVFDLSNGTWSKEKKYDKAETDIRMTLFDRQAEALTSLLQPGAEILVSGSVSRDEYNGTVQYNLRPRVVTIMKAVKEASHGGAAAEPEGSVAATVNSTDFLDVDMELEGGDDILPF